ncbi:hypothetical protein [Erythrobacter sp. Alg231-14]|uniref:hypothetical protein n=1 Tax=Erythrobacter sp. Alg231-14 TaxID=1922225 RepID=UPI000D55A8CE
MAYKNHLALTQSSALALATGLVLASSPAQAQSLLAQGTVAEGSATITIAPDATDVSVETNSAVIDWVPDDQSGFGDILLQPDGTTLTFTNGTGISDFAVLNRITPIDPFSRIILDGNIVSQIQDGMGGSVTGGTVFFYTPGGIVIGSNAVIDVGNLGLTTAAPLTDGNGNFIINDTVDFQQAEGFSDILIEPGAQINALEEGSYVALFAPAITQAGNIQVNGQAALVAAEAGTITFSPDGLFDIQVSIGNDNGFAALEHSGTTGGPGSTGIGDNHRIYMVSISKNAATTLAINGGSSIGFDVAQVASMDGDVVVLSSGYNITVGEIEDVPVNPAINSFIDINDQDVGNGSGVLFTSQVVGQALTDVNITSIFSNITFEESASFLSGGINVLVDEASGFIGSLDAQEDLTLIAGLDRIGQDAGDVFFRVNNGAVATVAGNLVVASNASIDSNGTNTVTSGTAQVLVNSGGVLNVGGNLIADASVDLTGTSEGFDAEAGFATVFAEFGGATIDVGGVIRVLSNAVAGIGGRATASTAEVRVQNTGVISASEMNISADATAGEDFGLGGNIATAGTASLIALDAGSSVTVLNGNTIGDGALGELDFLSSEAFASNGVSGNGGDAFSGNTELTVESGATVNLANDPLNPLFIVNTAIAGDTLASDSVGGQAQNGSSIMRINDTTANLGRLSVRTLAQGGSAVGMSERSSGGNATGGFEQWDFNNSDVTIAFDEIRFERFAGSGSLDGLGVDGGAFGNDFNIFLASTIFDVQSDLLITTLAVDGDGSAGDAGPIGVISSGGAFNVAGNMLLSGPSVSFTINDNFGATAPGTLQIDGDLTIEALSPAFGSDVGSANIRLEGGSTGVIGGNVLIVSRAMEDANGDGGVSGSFAGISVEGANTALAIGGNAIIDASVDLSSSSTGLDAISGNADVSVQQGASLSVGGVTRLLSNAIAGDDGNATGSFTFVGVFDGGQFTTGELSLSADAIGGEGGLGAGGNAIAGTVEIAVNGSGSSLTVLNANTIGDAGMGELEFLSSEAFGGLGIAGDGGDAIAGSTNINVTDGGTISLPDSVLNPLLIVNTAIGGDTIFDNAMAGFAQSGFNRFVITDSIANLGRLSVLVDVRGGSGLAGSTSSFGGDAFLDNNEFLVTNSDVDVAFDSIRFIAEAGSASPAGFAANGNLITGTFNFVVENSLLNILSNLQIDATGFDGNNDATNSQNLNLSLSGSGVTVAGDIDLSASTATLTAAQNFSSGNSSTLDVAGNISLVTTGPNFGGDGGRSEVFITGGSAVSAGGSVLISALANGDFDNNGTNSGGSARLIVENLGSTLDVAGNLVIDASADLSGTSNGLTAQGGFAELFMQNGVQVTVGGVTRMLTNAHAGDSGSAIGGNAQLSTFGGALFTTGELNMSADATGGLDVGGGAGDATGGTVGLTSSDDDSAITILSGNVTGDVALGELDFMSSEAIGGAGVFGSGGNANGGFVNISIRNGGTAFFGGIAGTPLTLLNTARGGDTEASDSTAGSASSANIIVDVSNSTADLGTLSLIASSLGGSASGGAQRTNGGFASGGTTQISFFNADVDVAFDSIILEQIGGNGTGDVGIAGGGAFGGNFAFSANSSTVDILSGVLVFAESIGGDGHQGGNATGVGSVPFFENSTINIDGSFFVENFATGGNGIGSGAVVGGNANTQFIGMQVRNTALTANGVISVGSRATGGDASEGTAGNATASETFVGMFGGSTITANSFEVSSRATGGSIQPGGAGRGGDANSARAAISFDGGVADGPVTFTGDVVAIATATGGDGGDLGGDGGNAVSGGGEFRTFEPGTFNVGGDVTLESDALGGDSTLGMGGTSQYGFIGLSTDGGQINITGDVDIFADSDGGDGLIGGDATGNLTRIAVTGGGLIIGGELTVETDVSGGDGVNGALAGDGGVGTGNTVLIDARNNDGGIPSLIRVGSLDVDVDVDGGSGGDGGTMADGGVGGDANGGSAFIFGRAINGTLEVLGRTNINIDTRGGRGGNGVNGGAGGDAIRGAAQFGTASGGAVPNLVEGAATFDDIDAEVGNFGGDGGDATTGVGGDGGDARQGVLTLLTRGALVTAADVELTGESVGGDGGSGATAGNGGNAAAATLSLAVSQAFQNPGRGALNLGEVLMETFSTGGTGAVEGASQFSTGGEVSITQSDAVIESLEINLGGETAPDFLVDDGMGGLVPVTVNPFRFALTDATLNGPGGEYLLTTLGDVNLVVADSVLETRLLEITAANFVAPDPSDPPLAPGEINVTQEMNLISTVGDIFTQANISGVGTNSRLNLTSAGSIFVGDVTAPNITLSAPNGQIVTGAVDSSGGGVSLVTGDPIDLGSITAEFVTAVSTGGDITSNGVINVTGALDLTAAGSIVLADVTAGSVSATAQAGDIIFSSPLVVAGDILLNAAGLIQLAGLSGGSLFAESEDGDIFSDGLLDVEGAIDLNASGSIDLDGVNAESMVATTGQFGTVTLNGPTVLDTSLDIAAGGTIDISDVTAASVTAMTLDGNVISSGALNVTGAVDLQAPGDIEINDVNAGLLNAQAQTGVILFVNQNPLIVNGAITLDAAGLIQFDGAVIAGSINASSGDQIFAGSVLSAGGDITLNANGSVDTTNVSADSLTVTSGQFASINLGGVTSVNGAVQVGSGGSVTLGDVNAGSLDVTALDGNITANSALNVVGLIDLDAVGSIELRDVVAGSLVASTQIGDVTGLNPIVVTGSLNIDAAGNAGFVALSGSSITVQAGELVQVNDDWQSELIDITGSRLEFTSRGGLDAGEDGTINLTSTNDQGVFLTDTDNSGIQRFVVDTNALERMQSGQLVIAGAANFDGADIEIGDLDLSSSPILTNLILRTLDQQGDILVRGNVTASASDPIALSIETGQFMIDSTAGSIDLLANGGSIAISADTIAIGEASLFDALTGDETAEELFDLLSAPAATSRPDGVLNGATLIFDARDDILVQNTGTEEAPAGITVASAEGLQFGADRRRASEEVLFVINAQINDGTGNVLTGDEAATAIIDVLPEDSMFAAGSRFNGCELGGCDATEAPAGDQGEVTSTVSAAISGTGSSGSSGSGNSGSGDSGADSGGNDDSGSGNDEGSDDSSGSSAGANTGSSGSGSNGGGDVSADNVDDGGGGNEDFVIEDTDDGSSDSGSGSDDSDSGSSESDGDSGEDSNSSESDDSEAEGEESESEEAEESEEEESEEEEEEAAEEEEEESEGPASGPIAPPVSIISTNALDRNGAINDPISGSGNPGLIDPDVTGPQADGNGEQP